MSSGSAWTTRTAISQVRRTREVARPRSSQALRRTSPDCARIPLDQQRVASEILRGAERGHIDRPRRHEPSLRAHVLHRRDERISLMLPVVGGRLCRAVSQKPPSRTSGFSNVPAGSIARNHQFRIGEPAGVDPTRRGRKRERPAASPACRWAGGRTARIPHSRARERTLLRCAGCGAAGACSVHPPCGPAPLRAAPSTGGRSGRTEPPTPSRLPRRLRPDAPGTRVMGTPATTRCASMDQRGMQRRLHSLLCLEHGLVQVEQMHRDPLDHLIAVDDACDAAPARRPA